ncbi:MAG: efflux RND transporter periplasmic adaptor subunit [Thermoanaerobaculia bacterium]
MKKLVFGSAALVLLSAPLLFAWRNAAPARAARTSGSTPPASAAVVAPRVAAEGRVVTYPGGEVVVGTDFAGTLLRLAVKEKDVVRKGDLLAELNASEEKAALVQARARITEAEADVKLAHFELARAQRLRETKVGTEQAVDKASRDREAAVARRDTAAAQAEGLVARIAKSRVLSPLDGVVMQRHAETGETVDRGARLVTVANLKQLRVEAEVDEADSERIALGAVARVKAEGDPTATWLGRVEEIPDAVTFRRLKPQDPGRPSDTRVLLVKIALPEKTPLKLGRRVELSIESAPAPAR